jgi:hypothetical protein
MATDASVERVPPSEARSFRDELKPEVKRQYWLAQRTVWGLMLLVLVAAALGLLGNGLLSHTKTSATSGGVELEVAYERWLRADSPQQLDVRVTAPESTARQLQLVVSSGFLDAVDLDRTSPAPESVELTAGGTVFTWPVSDWSKTVTVALHYSVKDWGRLRVELEARTGGAPQRVRFTQFALP